MVKGIINIGDSMKTELETLKYIRKLMAPHICCFQKKHWIAGTFRPCEEYVLVELRQKVLRRIEKLERVKK